MSGLAARARRGAQRAALLALLPGTLGCISALPAELRAPRTGAVVLPAGGTSFFVFEAGRVARLADGRVEWEESYAAGGDPAAAGVDLSSAWAAVAFPSRLVFVHLATRKLHWVDSPFGPATNAPHQVNGLAIRGETATLWSASRIAALRVPSGEKLWEADLAGHLDASDLNYLAFALPRSDDGLVVVASREGNNFTDGAVVAQRIDRSRGDWRIQNQNTLPGMTWAHRTASEGEAVFVAGLWEDVQLRPGTTGRLWQKLLVCRVELDSLEVTELVWAERQARSTVVRDLVIGTEALAVLLDAGTVQIYRIVEGGGATAPLFERHYDAVDSIAWISDTELVVMTPGGPEVVRY